MDKTFAGARALAFGLAWLGGLCIGPVTAQPTAPPNLLAGRLPDWIGAAVAGLVVGGILFAVLCNIGDAIGRRTGRRGYERAFIFAGWAALVGVFVLALIIL